MIGKKKPPIPLRYVSVMVVVVAAGFWYRQAYPLPEAAFLAPPFSYGEEVEMAEEFQEEMYRKSLVNINTAEAEELMELDGVGEKTAAAILAYRQAHGPFEQKEDLMEVDGIGEKTFAALKTQIILSEEERTKGER